MSDSRLEKFIYAICSMDVSDLPVPLSRIEKLWNCLITGETPDFEPLSRNEKYLMVMLDRYDISNLPAPMSRGEKLLYKIAVGETDLSDVPDYLSRYEELLKYLIENCGISGGDFEYVLYTLNQSLYTLYTTAEKPVKSAILKGQTLVNIKGEETNDVQLIEYSNHNFLIPLVKKNTDYLIKYDTTLSGETLAIGFLKDSRNWSKQLEKQPNIGSIRLNSGEYPNYFRIIAKPEQTVAINNLMIIEYQEGMENWDIPYFEGMQSVKMPVLTTTGKNLFDMSEIVMSDFEQNKYQSVYYGKEIQLQPNTTYTIKPYLISEITNTNVWTVFNLIVNGVKTEVVNVNYTGSGTNKKAWNTQTFETDETGVVGYSIYCHKNNEESWFGNLPIEVQLEEGSTATTYEPYKSNILTINEDVELRGIGEGSNRVEDELDCLTGELTQRIGEIVLDGSENWTLVYNTNDVRYNIYSMVLFDVDRKINNSFLNCLSDKAKTDKWDNINANFTDKTFSLLSNRQLRVQFNGALEELKNWLLSTKPTIQYIKTKSIKTVDLTVVDQDNQPTELGTFENVTHVSLEAENLIPEVEMGVATRISEELTSASPLMDDISTKQQQLNTMVDEQSENVDATMIATTEIFEETL